MTPTLLLSIRGLSWGYLILAVTLWFAIMIGGDRWWLATVVLFAPRWLAAIPLMVLLPLAAWRNQRCIIPLLLGTMIVSGPFMGFCMPMGKADNYIGPVLRVLTCNIDDGNFNEKAFAALIRDTGADIVALQECPQETKMTLPPGWQIVQERGLAILSRFPLRRGIIVQVFHPPNPWPSTCLLQCSVDAPEGEVDFCSVQLPTPRFGMLKVLDKITLLRPSRNGQLIEETAYRRRASQEVRRAVASLSCPVIVAGDFNMPVDSTIYKQIWKGYSNAFSNTGFGYGWTQRVAVKGLKIGIRIDHVLTCEGVGIRVCEVGPDVGSDHLPLIADICMVKR